MRTEQLQRWRRLMILLLLLASAAAGAQPVRPPMALATPLPLPALLQDLEVFRQVYEAANPSLYSYRTRRQLDSAFAATRHQLSATTTLLDFYRLLYGITTFTGSLHSDNYLPAAADSALQAGGGYFPYPLQLLAGHLRLNSRAAPLPLGSDVVSINGHPVAGLLAQLGTFATTDGYNQTGKAHLISAHFARYYYLAYGPCAAFRLTYRAPYQVDTAQVLLAAVAYPAYARRYAQRASVALEATRPPYGLRVIDSARAAVLTVNDFELGGLGEASQRRYARFLDSAFRVLRARPAIRHLVMDVRQNTGGDDPNDVLLFSYLARHRYRENRGAFTIFRQVPYPEYFVEDSLGERVELEQQLRAEYGPARRGRHWLRKAENPYWRPNPLAFRGQVYLLVGPAVASAGSLFASLVRSQRGPIVIGEETMGGYYGHTGHTPVEYRLPNTGIRVKFSIVDLAQDVRRSRRFPRGRGVLPDYPVTQNLADFIHQDDAVLRKAWELINQSNSALPAGYLPPSPRR